MSEDPLLKLIKQFVDEARHKLTLTLNNQLAAVRETRSAIDKIDMAIDRLKSLLWRDNE